MKNRDSRRGPRLTLGEVRERQRARRAGTPAPKRQQLYACPRCGFRATAPTGHDDCQPTMWSLYAA